MKEESVIARKLTFLVTMLAALGLITFPCAAQDDTPISTAGKPTEVTRILLPHTRYATRYYINDSGVAGPTVMVVGGAHGNEPAGALAAEAIRHWTLQRGKLVVIPCANIPGLAADKRLIPGLDTNLSNLNRDYPKAHETNGPLGDLAQAIWQVALENKPAWVLDLHEGYDFNQLNDKSVGSSIICFPILDGQRAADSMLETVNSTIKSNVLKFVRRDMPVDGSLARAVGEHLHVPGMTIETTKLLPIETRITQQEIIVHRLLERLKIMTGSFDPAKQPPLVTDIRELIKPPRIMAALYKGPGTGGNGPPALLKYLNNGSTSTLTEVSPKEIRDGVLTNYDVVVFAGGSGSKEAEAIGEEGRAQVTKFVSNGGGYIGICAGAYLATSGYPWSLHIINAKTLSPKWQRGKAVLKMEMTPEGSEIFGGSQKTVDVLYHNGPVVGPAKVESLPPYEPLAFFRTETAEHETPKGIQLNSPAIFAGHFHQGKVICISPHPEQTEKLEYIVPRALNWVAPETTEEPTAAVAAHP